MTKNSPICRTISEYKAICTTCPVNNRDHTRWSIALADGGLLDQILSDLHKHGVSAKVAENETVLNEDSLTFEQFGVIEKAEVEGYFEFPRRISMSKLAKKLAMSKSNLEEIVRRAIGKIVGAYVECENKPR